MKLVLNANVIFSALLRGRPLSLFIKLKDKGIELITPNFLVEEFLKRKKELANALGISETKLSEAFSELISKLVRVVPKEKYVKFLIEAKKVSPDKKDTPYFALSLAFNKAPIWPRGPRLKRQKIVKVLNDKEIEKLFL